MQAVYSLWSSMSAPLTSEEYWPFSTSSDIARSVRHTNGDFLHDGIAAADTVCAISARAVSQQAKGRPSQSRVPKPYRAIRGVATHERPSAPENPFKHCLDHLFRLHTLHPRMIMRAAQRPAVLRRQGSPSVTVGACSQGRPPLTHNTRPHIECRQTSAPPMGIFRSPEETSHRSPRRAARIA